MPAGDFGLYREAGGGTAFSSTGATIDLDTTDVQESTFSRTGGEVTVKEACRVLCFAGMEAAKDAGGAETALMRVEVDQNTGTFLAEPSSYCQGYFSDLNGVTRAPMASVSLIDAVANAKVRLYAETKASSVLESAARTFLQLYRLPNSIQVVHLLRSTNLNTIGTTYVDVPWNSEILKDSSFTHSNSTAPAEVTWTGPASRVLVLFSLTVSNPTGTSPDRLGVGAHLLKNGSAVDFSQVTGHIRGTGDDINVTLRLAIPIDLATNDVLKVQVKVFARPGSQTARVVSNRATMTVLAMPGSQSWLQMRNSANQDADSSSLDFLCNAEDEKGPAFSHSTSSNTSEVTLQRTHRYLLGYKVSVDRGASATADNMAWDSFWRKNNSTDLDTRGGGGFSEGAQASVAYRESSITGAMIVAGAGGDIYELRIDKIGSGADSNADFLGGTGETKSLLWGLDLDELRPVAGYALAGISSRASPKVVHSGRARCSPGATDRVQAVVAHQGRARCGGGSLERAQAVSVHSGRAKAVAGVQARAIGSKTIRARVTALLGVLTRAAPQLTIGGGGGGLEILARGRALFGIQARAIAQAVHGARGRVPVGAQERAKARVTHAARGRSIAGMAERAAPQGAHQGRGRAMAGVDARAPLARGFLARCKALLGVSVKAKAAGVHGASGKALVGQTGRAAPSKIAGARGRGEIIALIKAKAQAVHQARGRALIGATGRVPLTPEEVVGFYERTAKRVRMRLKAVAGSLAIHFANLDFQEPDGAWARAKVSFEEPEDPGLGGGVATYIVPGELVVDLRVPIQLGKGAAMALADELAEQLQMREASGVIYRAAAVTAARDVGSDEYEVKLRVPFRAEDSGFRLPVNSTLADDDFEGGEAQVRARFRETLPDVVVSYDNLIPSVGAVWVRLDVHETQAFDVDGMRRTVGVMEALIHVPIGSGEKAALRLADRIVEQFRMVDAGGVRFSIPTVPEASKGFAEWVQPVFCPWSCDHA